MAKAWGTVRRESLKPWKVRANVPHAKGALGECRHKKMELACFGMLSYIASFMLS